MLFAGSSDLLSAGIAVLLVAAFACASNLKANRNFGAIFADATVEAVAVRTAMAAACGAVAFTAQSDPLLVGAAILFLTTPEACRDLLATPSVALPPASKEPKSNTPFLARGRWAQAGLVVSLLLWAELGASLPVADSARTYLGFALGLSAVVILAPNAPGLPRQPPKARPPWSAITGKKRVG